MSTPTTPASSPKTAEVARVAVSIPPGGPDVVGWAAQVASVQPTQLRRPWRTTARTLFQLGVALVTLIPFIATGVYGTDGDMPAVVVQILAVDAAIARVMATPQVEQFLRQFLPFLAAAPRPAKDKQL